MIIKDNAPPSNVIKIEEEDNGELSTFKFVKDKFSPNLVFSVGASEDHPFFDTFIDSCEIHMFDPNPTYFQLMERQFKGEKVHLNNYGLGDENKSLTYHFFGESFYDHSDKGVTCDAQITTLDDYCSFKGVHKIDFMKIDTEGYEYKVLKGGKNMLENSVSLIQFEYGERYPKAKISLRDIYDLLDGWYIYLLEPESLNLQTEPIENYIYSNYLASKEKLWK